MDDERAGMIIGMLTEVQGELAALAHEDGESCERLDLLEADMRAVVPLVAEGLGALVDLKGRIERLEALVSPV